MYGVEEGTPQWVKELAAKPADLSLIPRKEKSYP